MHVSKRALEKISKIGVTILIGSFIFNILAHAPSAKAATGDVFLRNLKQGDTVSPDVAYLQYILNAETATEVASTGPGSNANLTTYFGPKTKDAVMRFQVLYKDEILVPAGLTSPTGIVGMMTRAKLNQLARNLSVTSNTKIISNGTALIENATTGTSAVSSGATRSVDPSIRSFINLFSTYKAFAGQMMSIYGANFHPTKNTIYLGSTKIGDFPSTESGVRITFGVPTNLETGSYEIGLINAYGTTSSGDIYLNVIGKDSAQAATKLASSTALTGNNSTAYTIPQIPATFNPIIDGVYPLVSSNINDEITLYGNNFATKNTLETNLGNIIIESINRQTSSFLIGNLPYYMEAFNQYKGRSINVVMNVRNENGKSTTPVTHVIKFPNTLVPTVNTNLQEFVDPRSTSTRMNTSNELYESVYRGDLEARASSSSSTSGGGSNSSAGESSSASGSNSSNGSNVVTQANSQLDSVKPEADPALAQLREISPVHKFLTDPLVKGGSSGSGSSGGGILGGLAGGLGGGSSGGGAGAGGGGQNLFFGGPITRTITCTCSTSVYLEVADKATNQTIKMLYTPGQSTLHDYRNIWTVNVNVIGGLQQGGGDCEVYSGNSCQTQGTADYTIDYIRGIGTSKR